MRHDPDSHSERIRQWFAAGELQECPECRTQSLVSTDDGDTYCNECGHLPGSNEPLRRETADSSAA